MEPESDTSAEKDTSTSKAQMAHIRLTPESADILETIKTEKGISNTEAVNRALKLFDYMIQKQDDGWEMTAKKPGRETRYMEVIGI